MAVTKVPIKILDGRPAPKDFSWCEGCAVEHDTEREEKEADGWAYWRPVANSHYQHYIDSKGNKINIDKVIRTEGPHGEIVFWLYSENYKPKQGRT